jgi:thymidylate synthase (FAD)
LVVHDFELQREWEAHQEYVIEEALAAYEWALENNIAKEQARAVLPEGLTETTLYMSGTLRSWVHYCQLRMGNGTQLEHSQIAQMAWEIIKKEFPDVAEAMDDNS